MVTTIVWVALIALGIRLALKDRRTGRVCPPLIPGHPAGKSAKKSCNSSPITSAISSAKPFRGMSSLT
jgi:hypothetical protein